MQPNMQVTLFLIVSLVVMSESYTLPYSRSTPGVIRTRPSLNDVLNSYLHTIQQSRPEYGYPEYQPLYQQGYIAQRPRRVDANLEAILPYLNAGNLPQDYPNYDFVGADQMYTDNDGTWYDDVAAAEPLARGPAYNIPSNNELMENGPTEQDIALARLMLDHMEGRYSLEDLETLEREARIEENTENQLRALASQAERKNTMVMNSPRSRSRSVAARMVTPLRTASPMPVRRGQKEEPVMVPATSVRRPIFVQQLQQEQKMDEMKRESAKKSSSPTAITTSAAPQTTSTTKSSTVTKQSKDSPLRESGVVEVVKVGKGSSRYSRPSVPKSSGASPYMQPAYEALKKYLDQERQARISADEEIFSSKRKRFVKQEEDSLTQQLHNMKKSVA